MIGSLSVIIPAYNEEERIGSTLERVAAYMKVHVRELEIVVVDDGSTDGTRELLQKMSTGIPGLRVIHITRNRGKGHAVRTGMLAARGRLRLLSDADLSTPIEEVERLLPWLDEGAHVVIGSRGLRSSEIEVHQPWHRESMGKTFNLLVRLLGLSRFRDTQCGFKVFRAETAEEVFSRSLMEGFSFDVEVLFLAERLGYRVREVPVRWRHVPASRVRVVRDSLGMLLDLVVIRMRWFLGRYGAKK
jgi:dolichyl-phosphate beta-glucosyltransferase